MKKFLIVLVCGLGVFSFHFFDSEEITSDLENRDSMLAFTIDGESSSSFPDKTSDLKVKGITCNEEVEAYWDYEAWGIRVRNLSKSGVKCNIEFVQEYTESILNGADPVLKDGLVPVTIDDDGVVRKANLGLEWYRYEKKKWANAVILDDESIKYYDGEVIPESNIESYFVWIPKYKYKLWDLEEYSTLTNINLNQVHNIDLVFGTDVTNDQKSGECTTPMVSRSNGNCSVGDYMTHPAFLAFDGNGMWVGKFETGYKGAENTEDAQQNIHDASKVIIKPNAYSWRNIQVVNAFLTSYDYQRNLESHMMKNTEWGAVAYLQHSSYGSGESVRINNNSAYVTGYAAVNEPTCGFTATNESCNCFGTSDDITQPYNTNIGVLASTTGNITGIYDMSGGAWDYVMGVVLDENGKPMSGRNSMQNSGFNGKFGCPDCDSDTSGLTSLTTGINFPNEKYYDSYLNAENYTSYQIKILGDATGEMGPFATATYESKIRLISSWHSDEAYYINTTAPWFIRGGFVRRGSNAGIFSFFDISGNAVGDVSFRIVLSV